MSSSAATWLAGLLARERWTDEDCTELAELLSTRGNATFPFALETLLELVEHPFVQQALARGEAPETLSRSLDQALRMVIPMLGVRPLGSVAQIAAQARRTLEAEGRKHDLVQEHLAGASREHGIALLTRYLRTQPAIFFQEKLRTNHPDWMEAAEEAAARSRLVLEPDERAALLESLRQGDDAPTARALLTAWNQAQRDLPRLASIFRGANREEMLLVGALALFVGRDDFAHFLLEQVVEPGELSPQFAIIASRLHPEQTRQVLSLVIAEASWVNPEEPEAELTPVRVRALWTARALLPELGSPLDTIDFSTIPEGLQTHETREALDFLEHYESFWDRVLS